MITEAALASFMAALFSMMNPIGNLGVFAGLTANRTEAQAVRIAWVGADADITIFDPRTVRQNATPANGGLASTGIPYVVVNGMIVVKDSKVLKGVYPGKPIRRPVKH